MPSAAAQDVLQAILERRAAEKRREMAAVQGFGSVRTSPAATAPMVLPFARQVEDLAASDLPPRNEPLPFAKTLTGAVGESLYGVPVAGPAALGLGARLGAAGRYVTGRQPYGEALEEIQTGQENFRRNSPFISSSAQNAGSSIFSPAFGSSMGAQVVGNAAVAGADAIARGQDPTVAGVAAGGIAGATHLPAIFAGVAAKTANREMLTLANDLKNGGFTPEEIWKETGWFKGTDDKWRFEISDQESKLHAWGQGRIAEGNEVPAGKLGVLHHPDLYAAYPSLKETKLHGRVSPGSIGTQYGGSIGLAPDSPLRINKTLLHEMQHEVQDIEGFAKGGNTREFALPADLEQGIQTHLDDLSRAFDLQNEAKARGIPLRTIFQEQLDKGTPVSVNAQQMAHLAAPEQLQADIEAQLKRLELAARGGYAGYSRLAGETEARNVETRRYMTPEERRATPPWKTQDVPDEQQIVRFRDR